MSLLEHPATATADTDLAAPLPLLAPRARPGERQWIGIAILVTVLGTAGRLVLSWYSWGSNDATTWMEFGRFIAGHGLFRGLLAIYPADPNFNHPPIPGLWAGAAFRIAHATGWTFPFVFKLPVIAADAVTCWLLWKIWRTRETELRFAAAAVALYALNPVAILITAHHGNTDPIYATLALAAVYLIAAKRQNLLGGLVLGAAINVKLIPVLLIPPLLASFQTRREAGRFILGLVIAAIPFMPVLLLDGRPFYHNALTYAGYPCDWGITLFVLTTERMPRFSAVGQIVYDRWLATARWFLLAGIASLAVRVWRAAHPRGQTEGLPEPMATPPALARAGTDRYAAAACTMALFLVLTPGFGLQYAICVVPFLCAVELGTSLLYAILAGLMLLFTYWLMWDGSIPMVTFGGGSPRGPAPAYGLLAWAVLVSFAWRMMRVRGVRR